MHIIFYFLISILFLFSINASASTPAPSDPFAESCNALSPSAEKTAIPPITMGTTNNLRRTTGSLITAKGSPVIIYGKLLDEYCMPISDARIEAWQESTSKVIGSGTTFSNNLGLFTLLGVFPPEASANTLVHIMVYREDFPDFKTAIYLNNPTSTNTPLGIPSLTAHLDTSDTANNLGAPYYITLTLERKVQYRQY